MKKIVSFLVAMVLVLDIFPVYAENTLDNQDKLQGYNTVMQLIDLFGITDKDEAQLLKSAVLKLSEDDETYYKVLNAIAQSVDEHSYFYSPEELELLKKGLSGTIYGIGILGVSEDGYFEVVDTYEGGSAREAGIVKGDKIIEADGQDITGVKANVATDYIKGEKGTFVNIKVKKSDGKVIPLTLERREVIVQSVFSDIIEDKIGYININSFTEKTPEEVEKILKELKDKNIDKVIVDLRDNGGGIMDSGINTAALFMKKDEVIISTKTNDEKKKPTYYRTVEDKYNFKVALLVNENTASAAEIMTCALKENNHATVIGNTTYGKASAQGIFPISPKGALRVTTMHYFTPKGNFINKVGIKPNHEVDNKVFKVDIKDAPKLSYKVKYEVGMEDEEVCSIEKMLYELNYLPEKPDNIYDEKTKRAVEHFQKNSELFPYGVCDITTQTYLITKYVDTDFYTDDQLKYAIDFLKNK